MVQESFLSMREILRALEKEKCPEEELKLVRIFMTEARPNLKSSKSEQLGHEETPDESISPDISRFEFAIQGIVNTGYRIMLRPLARFVFNGTMVRCKRLSLFRRIFFPHTFWMGMGR